MRALAQPSLPGLAPRVVVGFTGTQRGATAAQRARLAELLPQLGACELHHGDCVGADADAHAAALAAGIPVVLHPPRNPAKRAWCVGAARVEAEDEYLVRNHAIVDACAVLIAVPGEQHGEVLRSGTWATVRYARRVRRRVVVVRPDGRVEAHP